MKFTIFVNQTSPVTMIGFWKLLRKIFLVVYDGCQKQVLKNINVNIRIEIKHER